MIGPMRRLLAPLCCVLALAGSLAEGEDATATAERSWRYHAPEAWWTARFLHHRLRDLDAALPLYEQVLEDADGELRAHTLYAAMYCRWLTGDQDGSRKLFDEIGRDFADHPIAAWTRRWSARECSGDGHPVTGPYRYQFCWVDHLAYDPRVPEPDHVPDREPWGRAHEARLDPGPGTWRLERIAVPVAVRRASPLAPWSNSPFFLEQTDGWGARMPIIFTGDFRTCPSSFRPPSSLRRPTPFAGGGGNSGGRNGGPRRGRTSAA